MWPVRCRAGRSPCGASGPPFCASEDLDVVTLQKIYSFDALSGALASRTLGLKRWQRGWRGRGGSIAMADITPLRGEGRTVGRIGGLWGELLSEFFGTFVLLAFGDGVVAVAVAGLPGSGRTARPPTIFNAGGDRATHNPGRGVMVR